MLPANCPDALQVASPSPHRQALHLARFSTVLDSRERLELESLGVEVLGYYAPATYLLAVPRTMNPALLADYSILSWVEMQPEWKMSSSLLEPPYGAWAVRGEWVKINLQAWNMAGMLPTAEWCRKQGGVVEKTSEQSRIIQAWVHRDSLTSAAALPFVQYLELAPPPGRPEDKTARGLHRAGLLDVEYTGGRKYNGSGVRVLVRDDGEVGPHIDFSGRLNNSYTFIPSLYGSPGGGALGRHGDAVAGIIGGSGNLDPTKKGMAIGTDLFTVDYEPTFTDTTLALHAQKGITLTNTSYSDGCNLGYTLYAQTVDRQLFEHPTLCHVFSAGNDGSLDCGYGAGTKWGTITGGHKTAKNTVVIANVYPDGSLETTSSRGPTRDGRLKPDICAGGAGQLSTNADNTYLTFGGTSGAAPGVTGCLAQLTQAYREWHNNEQPETALLKCALLNSAYDLGNAGPDFQFGFGLQNAYRALLILEQQRHLKGQTTHGAENSHTIEVPAGLQELRLMLVWSDPPGQPNASRPLVNDLDLRAQAPGSATTYLPLVLNSAPNPLTLNQPAFPGRDSVNTVEQIVVKNPSAGAYTVFVNGHEVPEGPQTYYLSWEFIDDRIKICSPNGGEGLVAGETERVFWDAYGSSGDFQLEYSDNGGASFTPVATVTGAQRVYDWKVPNTVSGSVFLRISRNGISDTTDRACSIAPLTGDITVLKVCPDSMTLQWNEVLDSLEYDVYLLGEKYMEIKAHSTINQCTVPIQNAGATQWISVRCTHPSGLEGRRAVAVKWPGGLKNCPQPFDLQVTGLVEPSGNILGICADGSQKVSVRLDNPGLGAVSGATLHYQANGGAVVSEAAPDLPAGSNLAFEFQTPLSGLSGDTLRLKVWSEFPEDHAAFNDTITALLRISGPIATAPVQEDFEAPPFPPEGWTIDNPDGWYGWEPIDGQQGLIGADGQPTRAYYVNTFDYFEYQSRRDYLYLPPVNLGQLPQPSLVFDLAHRPYDEFSQDGLLVELFPDCNASGAPVVLYERYGLDLSTQQPVNTAYIPSVANDWKRQVIDLSDYAGQTVLLRFSSVNGYGNNIFIDNIGIENSAGEIPAIADILGLTDTICRADTVHVSANQLTPNTSYAWEFGATGFPASAVGPGPHAVYYPTPGIKTITLYAENPWGRDTSVRQILARPFPTANFTPSGTGLQIGFNNTSTNADTYFWDFGDGTTGTETAPAHTYPAPGNYTVRLDAINPCKTTSKSIALVLTSGVIDLSGQLLLQVQPNPNNGEFNVQIDAGSPQVVGLQLYNALGQHVWSAQPLLHAGANLVRVQERALPAGLYRLQVRSETGAAWLEVVVE